MKVHSDFTTVLFDIMKRFKMEGAEVPVGHWQGIDLDLQKLPALISVEIFNYSFAYHVPYKLDLLRKQVKPNLPWADDHFLERVGREPLNPGEQYKNWPYYYKHENQEGVMRAGGKFTHSYMERFWPPGLLRGIRYNYGNLDNVVDLLLRQPFTRQAYFPIWFPEDTGVIHRGRVPCTLGYYFMKRKNLLHIFYPIRSCDFVRHFQDDVYLACRLLLWVLEELQSKDLDTWGNVFPGQLIMQMYSLHIWRGEVQKVLHE